MAPKVSGRDPTVTEGFACYWAFAAERQQVYYRRLAGVSGPLSHDSIIAAHRFTNAYRASDRVSQFLISEVQYNREWGWLDTFVRTLIFKIFNRIDTWRHIVKHTGEPDCDSLQDRSVDRAMAMIAGQRPLYSAAYIMPPPRLGSGPKYIRHLELIRQMVSDGAPSEIQSAPNMAAAFGVLRRYGSIGDFLAYQFVTDLNYSSHLSFSETEFVVPGPGALRGLRKCFSDPGTMCDEDLLRWTWERQEAEFAARGLQWHGLWGRPLQLVDVQNLFCELDKYTRVALPQLARHAPGKRIKQRYRPATEPMTAWFPPKWGLNHSVTTQDLQEWTRISPALGSDSLFQLSSFGPDSFDEAKLPGI